MRGDLTQPIVKLSLPTYLFSKEQQDAESRTRPSATGINLEINPDRATVEVP